MKNMIIDGTNVVRIVQPVQGKPDFAQESIIEHQLMRTISHLLKQEDVRVEVHFDGYPRPIYRPCGAVEVLFSKRHKADDTIINSVYTLSQFPHEDVTVVSQDKELQAQCKALGAHAMTGREFVVKFYANLQSSAESGM